MVEVENRTPEPIAAADVGRVVEHVLRAEAVPAAEVGVLLVGGEEMAELNRAHRGGDGPTDVLSFPIDEDEELPEGLPRMLGDVVVCPEVARAQAADAGLAPGRELAVLLVHGTLHLLGYDHEVDDGRMLARQDALAADVAPVTWAAA